MLFTHRIHYLRAFYTLSYTALIFYLRRYFRQRLSINGQVLHPIILINDAVN